MTMNELSPMYDNGGLDVLTLGRVFRDSGYFKDANDEAKAIVKILAGREMGIPAFAAMTGIHIIQGKPEVGAHLLARMVKESTKYDYRIVEHTDEMCSIRFLERVGDGWDVLGVSTFTMQDAKRAGLLSNATWGKYPRPMLFSRAMSNGVSMMCPDVTGGSRVYVEGEIADDVVGEDRRNVSVEVVETHSDSTPKPPKIDADRWNAIAAALGDGDRKRGGAIIQEEIASTYPGKEKLSQLSEAQVETLAAKLESMAQRDAQDDGEPPHPLDDDEQAEWDSLAFRLGDKRNSRRLLSAFVQDALGVSDAYELATVEPSKRRAVLDAKIAELDARDEAMDLAAIERAERMFPVEGDENAGS